MGRLKAHELARAMPQPSALPNNGKQFDSRERCGVCSMTRHQRAIYPGVVQGGCPMHMPEQNCPFYDHHRPSA